MTTTWQLWHKLKNPPQDKPFYDYVYRRVPAFAMPSEGRSAAYYVFSVLVVLSFPLLLFMTLMLLLLSPLLLLIASGLVIGIYWGWMSSAQIARILRSDSADLLAVVPAGKLELAWMVTTQVDRDGSLWRYSRVINRAIKIVLVILCSVFILVYLFTSASFWEVNRVLFGIIVVMIALWIDHVHSIVFAVVLSLLMPTWIRHPVPARYVTAALYLVLQGLFYLTIFVFYRAINTAVFDQWGNGVLPYVVQLGLTFASFIVLREALILFLWRGTLKRYDALSLYALTS